MKITLGLQFDKVSNYAKGNKDFLVVSTKQIKEGETVKDIVTRHGNFVLFLNPTPKYGSDCSLAIKEKTEDPKKPKYIYVGNGKTPALIEKLEFEKQYTNARLAGKEKELKNPFEATSISLSLTMTKIGDYIRKSKEQGKNVLDQYGCLPINIWINNQCDSFGNDVSVSIAKLTPDDETIYIGNGKTQAAFNEFKAKKEKKESTTNETSPENTEYEENTNVAEDDLPF
jgi:hypothetical protein